MTKNPVPSIYIIILNWNGKEDTIECLASVIKIDYLNFSIVVVDNGSIDDSVEIIGEKFPNINLLETGENLGYAGGNNVGICWAIEQGAEYILILNNDTIVSPSLLTALINATEKLPSKSVLGAKIYYYDKPEMLWFAGGRWLNKLNCFEHIGLGQQDGKHFDNMINVDYITGCALFVESNAFKEVGLLDEEFFLTYEETDWCYRAKNKGYQSVVVPEAKLWHKVSSSFGGANSPLVQYFMVRNKLLWAKKNMPLINRIKIHLDNINIFNRFLPNISLAKTETPLTKKIVWAISTWIKNKNRNKLMILATLCALRDYYLGNYGNCP